MVAAMGVGVEEIVRAHKFPLSEGWKLVVMPQQIRHKAGILCKARVIGLVAEMINQLPEKDVALLLEHFCRTIYDDVPPSNKLEHIKAVGDLMLKIRYIFEQVDGKNISHQIALDFMDFVYQNIENEGQIMADLQFSMLQAKTLIYFCKLLSPEEAI